MVFLTVDNTDIVEGYLTKNEINIEDVYIRLKKEINTWEVGLKSTKGSIRRDKSYGYPISFTWYDQGDYSFDNPEDHDM